MRVQEERGYTTDGHGKLEQERLLREEDLPEVFMTHIEKMKRVIMDQGRHCVKDEPLKEDVVGVHSNTLVEE